MFQIFFSHNLTETFLVFFVYSLHIFVFSCSFIPFFFSNIHFSLLTIPLMFFPFYLQFFWFYFLIFHPKLLSFPFTFLFSRHFSPLFERCFLTITEPYLFFGSLSPFCFVFMFTVYSLYTPNTMFYCILLNILTKSLTNQLLKLRKRVFYLGNAFYGRLFVLVVPPYFCVSLLASFILTLACLSPFSFCFSFPSCVVTLTVMCL